MNGIRGLQSVREGFIANKIEQLRLASGEARQRRQFGRAAALDRLVLQWAGVAKSIR